MWTSEFTVWHNDFLAYSTFLTEEPDEEVISIIHWVLAPELILELDVRDGAEEEIFIYISWVCPHDGAGLRHDKNETDPVTVCGLCGTRFPQDAGALDVDFEFPFEDFQDFIERGLDTAQVNPLTAVIVKDPVAKLLDQMSAEMLEAQAHGLGGVEVARATLVAYGDEASRLSRALVP